MTDAHDPIALELFKNALFAIADEMALTIVRTSYSGVIKDNMDFSTAFCDARGKLVAQGLTLPGHLGSIPTALEAVMRRYEDDIAPGDVFMLNDPYEGGMHLPDIFVFKRSTSLAGGWRSRPRSAITPMWADACRARTHRIPPRSTRKGSASRR